MTKPLDFCKTKFNSVQRRFKPMAINQREHFKAYSLFQKSLQNIPVSVFQSTIPSLKPPMASVMYAMFSHTTIQVFCCRFTIQYCNMYLQYYLAWKERQKTNILHYTETQVSLKPVWRLPTGLETIKIPSPVRPFMLTSWHIAQNNPEGHQIVQKSQR